MTPRVCRLTDVDGVEELWTFHCPGCGYGHSFRTKGSGPCWSFDGNVERPTFSPSLLVWQSRPEKRCHLFVRNGRIEFLSDCFHELAGKTVEMEEADT